MYYQPTPSTRYRLLPVRVTLTLQGAATHPGCRRRETHTYSKTRAIPFPLAPATRIVHRVRLVQHTPSRSLPDLLKECCVFAASGRQWCQPEPTYICAEPVIRSSSIGVDLSKRGRSDVAVRLQCRWRSDAAVIYIPEPCRSDQGHNCTFDVLATP